MSRAQAAQAAQEVVQALLSASHMGPAAFIIIIIIPGHSLWCRPSPASP